MRYFTQRLRHILSVDGHSLEKVSDLTGGSVPIRCWLILLRGVIAGGHQKSARFLPNYWRVLFQLMLSLWAWISTGNSTVFRGRVQAFFFATPPFVLPAPFAQKKGEGRNVFQDMYLKNWHLFQGPQIERREPGMVIPIKRLE